MAATFKQDDEQSFLNSQQSCYIRSNYIQYYRSYRGVQWM